MRALVDNRASVDDDEPGAFDTVVLLYAHSKGKFASSESFIIIRNTKGHPVSHGRSGHVAILDGVGANGR